MAFQTLVGHQLLHEGGRFIATVSRTAEYAANCFNPNVLPEPERIIELGLRGWVSEEAVEQVLCQHGISLDLTGKNPPPAGASQKQFRSHLWTQAYYATMELPSTTELMTLTNRGLLDEEGLDQGLRRLGFYSATVRGRMSNLRYEIPGSSDLVRFSVRHVFEPDLIERLGYNDEFRPILDFWHRLQGLNYPLFDGPFREQIAKFEEQRGLRPGSFLATYANAGLEDPTWAQAFWWSHWVVPSPTQAYEMYFRLRPGRDRSFDPPFARDLNFTIDDLNLNLRANDYPPRVRAALAAIAHRIPGIRFLRQLRATEVFDRPAVKELLLRQGYSDGDATVLAESVERNDRDARRRGIEQQAKGQLAKYWELGIIDQGAYRDLLVQHGMTPGDADQTVQLAQLDLRYKRIGKVVDYVRKQMVSGALNGAQAADQLRQAGIVKERADQYIQDWQLEVQSHHKMVAAGKLVQWACKGLIDLDQLQIRLQNLGYRPQDMAGLIAEARVCQATLATRAATQQEKQQRASQRQLQQTQRDAARAIVEARRQLAAHGSPSQLRKWFCAGHIGQPELYSRLRFLGWPDADITRLISDCKASTGGSKGGQRGGKTIGGG